jgi:hypothetical protein
VAEHRHKRDPDARRFFPSISTAQKVSAGLAVLATSTVVAVGVLGAGPTSLVAAKDPGDVAAANRAALSAKLSRADIASERLVVSRSASRKLTAPEPELSPRGSTEGAKKARADGALAATARAVRLADTKLWTTAPLNLWNASGDDATQVGLLPSDRQVLVTGRKAGDRVEVVVDGKGRWVTDGYLSRDKPVAEGAGAGLTMAPCPDSSVENGLTSNAVYLYRSVCHAFPQITSYGGWDAHGEHSSGRALDIMTSDVGLGTAIAEFLQAHSAELHIYDILWRQHIWTPVRASEGWRLFADRGSATANHYDHVHVSVY